MSQFEATATSEKGSSLFNVPYISQEVLYPNWDQALSITQECALQQLALWFQTEKNHLVAWPW